MQGVPTVRIIDINFILQLILERGSPAPLNFIAASMKMLAKWNLKAHAEVVTHVQDDHHHFPLM